MNELECIRAFVKVVEAGSFAEAARQTDTATSIITKRINHRFNFMNTAAFGVPEISLRHLKSALYVARHKNVTKAAIKLNRSQTAITKAISELEKTLKVELFDRTSKGVTPTVHGEALVYRVGLAAAEFDAAGKAFQAFKTGTRTHETISLFSMEISYKRILTFLTLHEKRDVAVVATSLGITKAAVYSSIRQLEELLEIPLFQRQPHSVAPTPYCHILARHCKLAFAQIRHALEDMANLDGMLTGRVIIGTLPYSRTHLTPRAINRLTEKYPQLDVATREGSYALLEAALRCGDIDFIVGATRTQAGNSSIAIDNLLEDRLSVIARKHHPLMNRKKIQLKELQDKKWVLPVRETPARQLFEETLNLHGMHLPEHAVETSSLSMVRGLLLDSDRIALLSEHQIYTEKKLLTGF